MCIYIHIYLYTYIYIFAKAVICNGQNHAQNYRLFKVKSVMEAVNCVCDDALDEHVRVSECLIAGGKRSGSPAIRDSNSMHCPVVNYVVLGTYKPQQRTAE